MNSTSAEQFVRRLDKLGTAERAALKAEAGRPLRPDVAAFDAFTAAYWPLRGSRLPRDASRLVAALYFWHPKKGGRGDLGVTLRRVASPPLAARTERILERLLAAPLMELYNPLFDAMRLLAVARTPVDWPQLLVDLRRWDRPTKDEELTVQEAWANSWLTYGSEHAD